MYAKTCLESMQMSCGLFVIEMTWASTFAYKNKLFTPHLFNYIKAGFDSSGFICS